LTPSRAQEDPTDAALQLAWLGIHRDKLQSLTPPSPTMRALAPLVAHRRRVVGDTGRITPRLTSTLKNYVPHVLQWFQDKETFLVGDFLSRWPTLKAVQRARRSTLETFLREHHVRSADVRTQRIDALKAATPLTTDEGIIAPHALLVPALIRQLRVTLHAIQDFDHAIAQRAQSHPDFPLFQPLPGAGPVFAPRLLVAGGEQRARDASAAARPPCAGIAPVTERSGKKSWVPWRFQCPTFLRQTFVEWAAESIRHAFWAPVYAQPQREKGKAHQAAVRARAFKWLRMLFRCWQARTPYAESVYLKALNRRGSALIHNLAQ
jgi:transposase